MEAVGTPEDDPPNALASGRIGAASIAFFGLAAAAPAVTLITGVPAVLAAGAGQLVPWSFGLLAIVLVLFGAGFTAMARRTPSAGAAYPQVARGLGRPAGLTAAWLAITGYQAIQFGLYALAGAVVSPLAQSFLGVTVPWWAGAAGCWAVVALLGTMRIEVAAGVLGLLAVAEAAVLAGLGASNLLQPAGGRITADSILVADPAAISRPVLGLLLAAGVLAFAGFESSGNYTEEAFRPRTTAAFGMYGSIALITLLLGGLSWTMIVATGPDRIAGVAGAHGGDLLLVLAEERLLPWAVTTGRAMLVIGVLAGILALHHAIARYLFAMGRGGGGAGGLGGPGRRPGAPRAASLTQSLIAGAGLGGAFLAGADPGPATARWMILGGALSVLVLLLLTSLAGLLHLNRVPGVESAWSRFVAPFLSTVSLGSLAYLAFRDLPAILGLPSGYPLVKVVPAAIAGCLALGLAHAAVLRSFRPERYAGIGLSGMAVVIKPRKAAPDNRIPRQRTPGAHRPERIDQ
jgi:amino acid transporter